MDQRTQTQGPAVPRTQMLPGERHRTKSKEMTEPESAMAAEWVLQAVQKLQARLAASTRPKKLKKYLKKLSALPITPDILTETGVRKTVKRLRKHELVGDLARDLAAQWKKLRLLDQNPGPGPQDFERSPSPEPAGDALQKEEMDLGYQGNWSASRSPSNSPEQGEKAHSALLESQRPRKRSHSRQKRDESKKRPRVAASPSDWGSFDCSHVQASAGPSSSHQISMVHYRSPEDPESTAPGRMPAEGRPNAFQNWTGFQEGPRPLDRPQEKENLLPKAKAISDNLNDQKDRESFDEECEEPTTCFEAYLTYDQPQKKKKKVKTSATAQNEKEMKENDSKRSRKNFHLVQNFPLSGNRSEKWQPTEVDSARMEEFSIEVPLGLPDPPSPSEQANHSPPHAYELMYCFRPNEAELSSPQKEEEAIFRKHSKMQVYSGSKCGYLTQMTSHQQFSQELTNDGYSVSVLEKCTPDQLYNMEKYNQVSVEETDQLWRIHCLREFKEEMPKENESWREMYLRLQDAREQRLQDLTLRIRSAHANEPPGRKTKMIFFKSPCYVPRRQENFRTVAAAASEKAKFKPAQHLIGSHETPSRSSSSNSSDNSSSSSSSSSSFNPAAQRPTPASLNTGMVRLPPVVNIRKSTTKKTAPLMAKAIKDYNRRISRR